MPNALLRKLSSFIDLSEGDRQAIEGLCSHRITVEAKRNLVREGERPNDVYLLLDGWGYRYKLLPDGGRHILAYLIPGDLCDIHIFILKTMDHTLGLLTPATVAIIPQERILEVMDKHPRIERALWWATLVDEAVLREWLVNIGQRDAYTRLAHLFCELWMRMRAVGLADEGRFSLPLTQEELGDTMGLTAVHVNRTLQRMRAEKLIMLESRHLTITDAPRLVETAGFEPNYLHLDRRAEIAKLR
ncbi:MAG TPA: Crp/Fnr family transcriptional regulator [Allosphingosinicella sp.]|nr:Crp/Fnr family transcriptional regulator [Allosphingosinicella sp.]